MRCRAEAQMRRSSERGSKCGENSQYRRARVQGTFTQPVWDNNTGPEPTSTSQASALSKAPALSRLWVGPELIGTTSVVDVGRCGRTDVDPKNDFK